MDLDLDDHQQGEITDQLPLMFLIYSVISLSDEFIQYNPYSADITSITLESLGVLGTHE